MGAPHALKVTRPVSGWNKPLKINYRKFFIDLGKAVVQGAAGGLALAGPTASMSPALFIGAIKSAIDAYSSFEKVSLDELLEDPGQAGWVLIHRSVVRAIGLLTEEHLDLLKSENPPDPEDLAEKLDLSLEEKEVRIDYTFFEQPKKLPVLKDFEAAFVAWLQGFGVEEAAAQAIGERLPTYFVFALHHEWGARPEDYAGLMQALDTPFLKASAQEQAWAQYGVWLQKQVEERMFEEAFGLRQVYVPLRAYYEEKAPSDEREHSEGDRIITPSKTAVRLYETLREWLDRGEKEDAIRVLSGGPGSGKSSFTKMLAARLADERALRVLYIPLHHFEISEDLIDAIGGFVQDTGILPQNPLARKSSEERLFLIFDGLDELEMEGRVGEETARQFVEEVQRKVGRYNFRRLRLQVLLSGREIVVQAVESTFRKVGQVLHLLPYYITESERKTFTQGADLARRRSAAHLVEAVWSRQRQRLRSYAGGVSKASPGRLDARAPPKLSGCIELRTGEGRL